MRTGNVMISAVKSGKIRFDGKRVIYQDSTGDEIVAYVSRYQEITTVPGNSSAISKKIDSWAKRKGYKVVEG
jgi:hypothetical protein